MYHAYDGLTDGQTGGHDEAKIRSSQLRERAYKCYNHAALNSSAGSLVINLKTPRHLAFKTKFKITSGIISSERGWGIYIYIYIYILRPFAC